MTSDSSPQALAFTLFAPFVDGETGRVDPRLLKALGLVGDVPYTGEFEKVIDPDENTSFDFYLEGPADLKIFVDVKLSESGFGSCMDDERQRARLEQHYRPYLTERVDSRWLEKEAFFKHYEILTHLSYLGRYPNSGVLFIYPKANQRLMASDDTIKRMAAVSLAPRMEILYLETLVDRILKATAGDSAMQEHYKAFLTTYLVPLLAEQGTTPNA
jgi:hypothetical protein